MPTTVTGYYDGEQVVVNQRERQYLSRGDQLIINIIREAVSSTGNTAAERRIRMVENGEFAMATGRSADEIENSIRELRDNDRI